MIWIGLFFIGFVALIILCSVEDCNSGGTSGRSMNDDFFD